jgi:hypothetical protein
MWMDPYSPFFTDNDGTALVALKKSQEQQRRKLSVATIIAALIQLLKSEVI